MGISVKINQKETVEKLRVVLSEYLLTEEQQIQYGVQITISSSSNVLGIVRVFSAKGGGATIDLSQIKSNEERTKISEIIYAAFNIPKKGEMPLPKSLMLRNDGVIESIKETVTARWGTNVTYPQNPKSIYCAKLDGITINIFRSGVILIQGRPTEVSDNLIAEITKITEADWIKDFYEFNKEKLGARNYEEFTTELQKMRYEDIVPQKLYDYLYANNKIDILDSLRLLEAAKTGKLILDNYISLVRPVAIVFEGFLIRFFIDIGLISEAQFVMEAREIRIGSLLDKGNGKSELERKYGVIFERTKPYLGSKLETYWKECRNMYLHSDTLSYTTLKLWEAETKIKELISLMAEVLECFEAKLKFDVETTDIDKLSCIGTDESGKGDFFGPLVVAGVYVAPTKVYRLLIAGVKDSKEIEDTKIMELEKLIKQECAWNVVPIGPKKYNELMNKLDNLNDLLAWGHARVLENLLAYVSCNIAIADQFGDESYITEALMEHGKTIKLIQEPKAERNIAVAAASILARAEFVRQIEEMGRELGFEIPKGSSNPKIVEIAKQIKSKYGEERLKDCVKVHFKTMEAV